MTRLSVATCCLLLCLFVLPAQAEYDYINISNPFLHKIPIAVPEFKPLADDDPQGRKLARASADLLSETLNFTCYFKTIQRSAFIERPRQTGITINDLTFKNWRDIGTEFLVTGGIREQDGLLEMELRLFDVFKEKLVVGKKYKAGLTQQRSMVRRFCSEIMVFFTGHSGIFESRLAFVSTGPGNKEIYTCEFDGYNPQRLTYNNCLDLSPAWSADGRWLAFTSYRNGRPDLYLKNPSENRGVIFSRPGINLSPAWMPNKFALAASLSFSGNSEIYLLSGTGEILKRLTHSWGIDVSPTFSPDGEKVAFVSKRAGTPQIFIHDIASGSNQRLTFEGKYNTNPSWSPTDNKIAYCSMDNGHFNIKVIDIKTGETAQLTKDQGDNETPTWSPDGSLIAFSSTRETGKARIFVMTAAGTDQKQLLSLPGEQTSPRWSMGKASIK